MMNILLLILMTLLGLAIGSFLNVVIYRYPNMLERNWKREAQEFLGQAPEKPAKPFNLAWPRSHCPKCQTKLSWWHNIPLLSFLMLGGKCAHCGTKISWQYFIVELITGGLTLWAAIHFQMDRELLWVLIFIWFLIPMAMIDLNTRLIPDTLVLPLLWLGLILNTQHTFTSLSQAVWGAVVGYLFLWVIAKLFKLLRKKDGMGHGDFKLLACLGAWFGVQMIPAMLLIAVILSLIVSLILLVSGKIKFQALIAFGPFLAISGWLTLMWGNELFNLTLRLFYA